MKAPRWNTERFWLGIMLAFVPGVIFALKMNLQQATFVLIACVLACLIIGRNFADLASESEESQKPLREQEAELASDLRTQGIYFAVVFLWIFAGWAPYKDLIWIALIQMPLPFQWLRRFRRLQRVRRELRHQSTLICHKLMDGA